MKNNNEKLSRAEKFGLWLARTKFGKLVFTSQARIIIFFSSFMLFTHALYWATAWYSPWPYIIFMLIGVWFGQGVYNQFSTIIKQSLEKDWDPTILKIAIPFILLNWAAFFACLYMFGEVKYTDTGAAIEGTWQHFYFSVVTLTTLGYGNIVPSNLTAEIIATIEALIGFMGFAVLAGLIASIAFKRAEINEKA